MPWAALPAVALSAGPAGTLTLPPVMLGGVLELDSTGRVFLFLVSSLWLVSGVLTRARLRRAGSNAFALLLLLAMSGSVALVLAGDALVFFAGATAAGYGLYGALVCGADTHGRKAGRLLVILLVLSDVLVFEVLLTLSHAAGAVELEALRRVLLFIDNQDVLLGMLIVGFGIKVGVLGVHFWMPPVFAAADTALRPALLAFVFAAGVLGALRLLPLGQIQETEVATVLNWLIWATLAYTVFVGLSQGQSRVLPGHVAIALGSVWLVVLSASLQQPDMWDTLADTAAAVLVQSGASMAAILLLERLGKEGRACHARSSRGFGMKAAALTLAISPMGLVGAMDGQMPTAPVLGAMAVIALLVAGAVFPMETAPSVKPAEELAASEEITGSPTARDSSIAVWTSLALNTVAMLAAGHQMFATGIEVVGNSLLIVFSAITVAVLNMKWRVLRLPALSSGGMPVLLIQAMGAGRNRIGRWLGGNMEGWTGVARSTNRRLRVVMAMSGVVRWLESILRRWTVALLLLVMLGLLVAWLAASYSGN